MFKAKIYHIKWSNKNKKEKLINTINLKNKSKKKKNPPKKIKEEKKKKKLKLSTKLKSNKHTIYKANNELVNNSNFLFFPKKITKKKILNY